MTSSTSGRASRPVKMPDPLPIPVVDNHCHLDMAREGQSPRAVEEILAEAARFGVDRVVHVGCSLADSQAAVQLAQEHPALVAAVALHPNEAPILAQAGTLETSLERIEQLARHQRVRAVGETGLDYFRTGPEGIQAQQRSFREHIAIAKRVGKPMQIHDRDAHEDVLRVLAQEGAPDVTVFHCFSGDVQMARECVARGYYLSFAGTITFKNAHELRQALAVVPLEQILVETDAPYLTPTPNRGATNAPSLMPFTVRTIAEVLGASTAEVCAVTAANAKRLYGPWEEIA
ncbi:Uncharacterized deoxyribonuclease YcfH [Dermatophilus congolensis]|uniref:Uncharacterized deoxyribonuclease YcfH n=2 Tax=Dermatophilus congolensis TaxID=1863 RepID=A0AA46H0R0_9MICO|nr:Uncharacterized deoxyribonuclease YcfH [Dermatophilus congolensis]